MSELLALTAAQAVERVRRREVSPGELWDAYRERAAADDLNAFTWVAEQAPAAPDAPLAGVPFAAKDLFCTEGVPSQAGSRILEDYRPPYTATVVARLAEAGAPLLGKTNQDEFAMGSSTENSGFGPTLNPWDRDRRPDRGPGGRRRRARRAGPQRALRGLPRPRRRRRAQRLPVGRRRGSV